MKTLRLVLGLFMVLQLTAGFVYAQDETAIPTASQLIVSHNVVADINGEDDDLYALLRGTTDSPLANDPLPDGIKGPKKASTSSK